MTQVHAHVLRPAEASDAGFVFSSWLGKLRRSPMHQLESNEVFYRGMRRRIESLLPTATLLIAADPEDRWHAFGFVCFDRRAVHWAYVKSVYRQFGVGKSLTTAAFESGAPRVFSMFATARLLGQCGAVFDPYVLDAK